MRKDQNTLPHFSHLLHPSSTTPPPPASPPNSQPHLLLPPPLLQSTLPTGNSSSARPHHRQLPLPYLLLQLYTLRHLHRRRASSSSPDFTSGHRIFQLTASSATDQTALHHASGCSAIIAAPDPAPSLSFPLPPWPAGCSSYLLRAPGSVCSRWPEVKPDAGGTPAVEMPEEGLKNGVTSTGIATPKISAFIVFSTTTLIVVVFFNSSTPRHLQISHCRLRRWPAAISPRLLRFRPDLLRLRLAGFLLHLLLLRRPLLRLSGLHRREATQLRAEVLSCHADLLSQLSSLQHADHALYGWRRRYGRGSCRWWGRAEEELPVGRVDWRRGGGRSRCG